MLDALDDLATLNAQPRPGFEPWRVGLGALGQDGASSGWTYPGGSAFPSDPGGLDFRASDTPEIAPNIIDEMTETPPGAAVDPAGVGGQGSADILRDITSGDVPAPDSSSGGGTGDSINWGSILGGVAAVGKSVADIVRATTSGGAGASANPPAGSVARPGYVWDPVKRAYVPAGGGIGALPMLALLGGGGFLLYRAATRRRKASAG